MCIILSTNLNNNIYPLKEIIIIKLGLIMVICFKEEIDYYEN